MCVANADHHGPDDNLDRCPDAGGVAQDHGDVRAGMTDDQRLDTCRKDIRRLEEQVAALKGLTAEQFRGRDEALKVALDSMEKRLAGMNEFRGAMEDQANRTIGREDYQNAHNMLVDRLGAAERKLAVWDGRLSGIAAALLLINALVSWYISHH